MIENLHDRWLHRWVTQKAKSNGSKIHGLGVIATSNIQKGEIVGVLGGVVVPKKEIKDYWSIMGHVGIQVNEDFFIVPTTREELKKVGVFNHSCEPNCGFLDSITLVSIKDIKSGDELTFDYAFCESYVEDFKCNCKLKNCRKIIKPTDWKDKKIQEKYFKYFSPYLKDKITN